MDNVTLDLHVGHCCARCRTGGRRNLWKHPGPRRFQNRRDHCLSQRRASGVATMSAAESARGHTSGGRDALLIGAILLAQSFIRVQTEDAGFPAEQLLIVRIERPSSPRFFLEARERLAGIPGVVEIGGITDFFIRRSGDQQITVEGHSFAESTGRLPKLVMDSVTPGYFSAMAIDIVEGRDFEDRDLEPGAESVVIVNDAIARRFWPNESAIGKRLVGGSSPPKDGQWTTIVGVVRDMRREGLDVSPICPCSCRRSCARWT